jgi:hypothetical protein
MKDRTGVAAESGTAEGRLVAPESAIGQLPNRVPPRRTAGLLIGLDPIGCQVVQEA